MFKAMAEQQHFGSAAARIEYRAALLSGAVHLHRLGHFRPRSQENLSINASALNLLSTLLTRIQSTSTPIANAFGEVE